MATNKTENFGLNQWVKSDQVVMEDFNEDNRKIEAAIAAAMKSPACVTGTYVGTGGTQAIELGFRPSFMMILCSHSNSGLIGDILCVAGVSGNMICIKRNDPSRIYSNCSFTDTGFSITDNSKQGMNYTDITYTYAAFY